MCVCICTLTLINCLHGCLGLTELGFAMTLRDVEELVESYISSTEHERGQKYVKHDG